jgi:hypothetical protein
LNRQIPTPTPFRRVSPTPTKSSTINRRLPTPTPVPRRIPQIKKQPARPTPTPVIIR